MQKCQMLQSVAVDVHYVKGVSLVISANRNECWVLRKLRQIMSSDGFISLSFCFLLFLFISSSDTCSDEKGVGDDVSCSCNNKTYLSSDKMITDAFSG